MKNGFLRKLTAILLVLCQLIAAGALAESEISGEASGVVENPVIASRGSDRGEAPVEESKMIGGEASGIIERPLPDMASRSGAVSGEKSLDEASGTEPAGTEDALVPEIPGSPEDGEMPFFGTDMIGGEASEVVVRTEPVGYEPPEWTPAELDARILAVTRDGEIQAEAVGEGLSFTEAPLPTKADIVFIIDSTGSMSDEIQNVKNNLNSFTQTLDENGVDFAIAIIEYKDATIPSEAGSTRVLTGEGGKQWFTSAEEVAEVLSRIVVDGGGDYPETMIDAFGCALEDLEYRDDASKFAVVLTDADTKDYNNYGIDGMDGLIDELKDTGINTSVISLNSLEDEYHDLYTETDGIFCDIRGNFADELAVLAEHVKEVTRPVTIQAVSSTSGWNPTEVTWTLTVRVASTDAERTAHNVTLSLNVPSVFTVEGAQTQSLGDLGPGAVRTVTWNVRIPVMTNDRTYTWFAQAASEDFAVGVVCQARDTFQVVGNGITDYNWHFGEDNYSFINSSSAFSYNPYYIADEDLKSFLDQLSNTEVNRVADWYAVDGTVRSLENNRLDTWGGSCYGMSLSADLFKVGLMDPADYGADTTYGFAHLNPSEDSLLESMINIYHISQATDIAVDSSVLEGVGDPGFAGVIDDMWTKAGNIGTAGSAEQPYLVRLRHDDTDPGKSYGHAVVCYGSEEGDWEVDGIRYHRRLLIADPNETGTSYIYIADDSSSAYYDANPEYNGFGYRNASLSELNTYDYGDTAANRDFEVSANETTDLVLTSGGTRVVIIAGQMVLAGDAPVTSYTSEDGVADGGSSSGKTLYMLDGDKDVTIEPYEEGGSINSLFTFGDYSTTLDGTVDSMTLSRDGDISVSGAKGNISLDLAANDSDFDFINIAGNANGDVQVTLRDNALEISGNLKDYTVTNRKLGGTGSALDINGVDRVRLVIEDGELTGYADLDGDGTYETPLNRIGAETPAADPEPAGSEAPAAPAAAPETADSSDNRSASVRKILVWRMGSEKGLRFEEIRMNSHPDVYVEETLLAADLDYIADNGILELLPEYLNTLAAGEYRLTTDNVDLAIFRLIP